MPENWVILISPFVVNIESIVFHEKSEPGTYFVVFLIKELPLELVYIIIHEFHIELFHEYC